MSILIQIIGYGLALIAAWNFIGSFREAMSARGIVEEALHAQVAGRNLILAFCLMAITYLVTK